MKGLLGTTTWTSQTQRPCPALGAERRMAEFPADTSALTRRDTRAEVRSVIEPLLLAGRIATCSIVEPELLYSARARRGTPGSRPRSEECLGSP